MAVILAKSAAITKSRLAKGFNGDNLNIDGKVVPLENADKGFKAAGEVKPPYVAAVASGNRKGFAAGAATAFNDYKKDIEINKYNAEQIINKYFDDMDAVVEKCGIEDSRLSIGLLGAYEDCVVAAKTGGCHILRFSDGELFEIALSDDVDGRGFQFIDTVNNGDIFALISEEAAQDLDYDGIVSIFDSGADLKIMLRDLFTNLASNSRAQDCSVILIRLESYPEHTFAAVRGNAMNSADIPYAKDADIDAGEFSAEEPIDENELFADEGYVSDSEKPKNSKKPGMKKKILNFIPIAILVIILAVAAALYVATNKTDGGKEPESWSDGTIFDFANEDTSNDENGSNGMQEVTEPDNAAPPVNNDIDDENENNNNNNNNNNEPDEPDEPDYPDTPDVPETTTAPPPETTTEPPETTTAPPETTTAAPETTTAAPDEGEDNPDNGNDDPEAPAEGEEF